LSARKSNGSALTHSKFLGAQVEKLGLLSKAEKAGFTLSKIEESGLLSFAESSGVLSLVADK